MAKVKVSGRCVRCVAVRKKEKKVTHGGTASTAFFRRRREAVRALWSLCRCEKKEEEGGSRRHSVHGAELIGTGSWRRQKSSGAVFVVSL